MDNQFGKHIFTQLEGMPPRIVTLTPCVNPVTGVPLFYGEVTNISLEPKTDPVQYVQGIVVRTLVWQEGKMEDYFSGSTEAVLKWNTTLKCAMDNQELRFVLFNFKKPLQKSTFSESSLALTTGTVAPEITCTAVFELAEALRFTNIGEEKITLSNISMSYKSKNDRYYKGDITALTTIPMFLYKPDSHDFRLKLSDEGHIIAEERPVTSSGRGKRHDMEGVPIMSVVKARTRGKKKQPEKEEEKAPEKEEEDRATLRSSAALIKKEEEEEKKEKE